MLYYSHVNTCWHDRKLRFLQSKSKQFQLLMNAFNSRFAVTKSILSNKSIWEA